MWQKKRRAYVLSAFQTNEVNTSSFDSCLWPRAESLGLLCEDCADINGLNRRSREQARTCGDDFEMVSQLSPLWPILFAVAGILLVLREAVGIRKHPERSATSRLFLLLAASLFTVAGFADLIIRLVITGRW